MEIQFKNQHIFFAVENIWSNLDYRFKFLLNSLITANAQEDFIQTVDVPEAVLIEIFKAVTGQPEGVATFINHEMLEALVPQIQAQSNMAAVMQQLELPNEALRILIAIDIIDQSNKATKLAKILNGKIQILS